MGDDLKDVGLRARFEGADSFISKARQVDAQAESLGRRLVGVGSSAQTAATKFSSVGASFGGMLSQLQKIGFAVFGVQQLVGAFQMLGQSILGPSMAWEQYQISFSVLLGSAEKAEAKLREFEAFAAKTPFTLVSVVDAAKQMLAYGFSIDEVLPKLTAIGDASSALGAETFPAIVRALGQMRAAQKVTAQDMNQLTQAGINAWQYLATSIGKSVAEVKQISESGMLPAEPAIETIIAGMTKQFGGLGAAQATSLKGMLSNLEDFWFKARRSIFGGVFTGIKQVLGGAMDILTDPAIEQFFASVGSAMGELLGKAIQLGQEVMPKVIDAVQGFANAWQQAGEKATNAAVGIAVVFMARGPIVAGLSFAIKMVFGLIGSFGVLLLKVMAVVAAGAALGAALKATWDSMLSLDFGGWSDRFMSNMKQMGATAERGMTGALGAMTGDTALQKASEAIFEAKTRQYQIEQDITTQQAAQRGALEGVTRLERERADLIDYYAAKGKLTLQQQATYEKSLAAVDTMLAAQNQKLAGSNAIIQANKAEYERLNGVIAAAGDSGSLAGKAIQDAMGEASTFLKGVMGDAFEVVKGFGFDSAEAIGEYFIGTAKDVFRAVQSMNAAYPSETYAKGLSTSAVAAMDPFIQEAVALQTRLQAEQTKTNQKTVDWGAVLRDATSSGASGVDGMTKAVQALTGALTEAEQAMRDLSNVRLPGMQAAEDEIFEIEMAIKRQRLAELGMGDAIKDAAKDVGQGFDMLAAQQREIAEGIPVALQKWEYDMQQAAAEADRIKNQPPAAGGAADDTEMKRLERLREAKQLMYDLTYEPRLRKLKETYETLSGANDEITFEQAMKGLLEAGVRAKTLRDLIAEQEGGLTDQEKTYQTIKDLGIDIKDARSDTIAVEDAILQRLHDQRILSDEELATWQKIMALKSGKPAATTPTTPEVPTFPNLAEGGTLTRGGMVTVGERGPELALLPTGTTVLPHTVARAAQTTRTFQDTFNIYQAGEPMRVTDAIRREMTFQRILGGRR